MLISGIAWFDAAASSIRMCNERSNGTSTHSTASQLRTAHHGDHSRNCVLLAGSLEPCGVSNMYFTRFMVRRRC